MTRRTSTLVPCVGTRVEVNRLGHSGSQGRNRQACGACQRSSTRRRRASWAPTAAVTPPRTWLPQVDTAIEARLTVVLSTAQQDPGKPSGHGATRRVHTTTDRAFWQISGKRRFAALQAHNRPGVLPRLTCWFVVEPPAGIEPATPSLPWNHREPLCGPPFPQVARDRRGRSYRFSLCEGMRSLPVTLIGLKRVSARGTTGCYREARSMTDRTSVSGSPAMSPARVTLAGSVASRRWTQRLSPGTNRPWV